MRAPGRTPSAERDDPTSARNQNRRLRTFSPAVRTQAFNGGRRMPDQFSKPGADGISLPAGFDRWQFGVSYTVRPQILAPLSYGREYRLFVRVVRKVAGGEKFTGYANLYSRATVISNSRTTQFRCLEKDAAIHARILVQGWWVNDTINLATVYLTTGISCLRDGDPIPQGEPVPTQPALTEPGGVTPQNYTPAHLAAQKPIDESYSDFDARTSSSASDNIFFVSYGEYVPTCDGLDYLPFIERAEALAKSHASFSDGGRIVRREWFCATDPDIAVVHIYVQKAE